MSILSIYIHSRAHIKSLPTLAKAQSSATFSTTTNKLAKIVDSAEDAVKSITSHSTVMAGGFGVCGIPENLIKALHARKDVKNLTMVSNNVGTPTFGIGPMLENDQIKRMVASYTGTNIKFQQRYMKGEIELEFVPQGTLVEKIRAGGAGIPFFYTPTGYKTLVQIGGLPIKYDSNGNVAIASEPKPTIEHEGKHYVREQSIKADFALVKAHIADKMGNLVFRQSARNLNDVMCKAAKTTIVEVEEIVETGDLDPTFVHVPAVYVDYIVKGQFEKPIEKLKLKYSEQKSKPTKSSDSMKEKIAKRAAREMQDGMFVNLGIGIPTLVADFIPENMRVHFHSENGVLNVGPYPEEHQVDPDCINAGKETITVLDGASFFTSEESFAMIRGGHIHITVLGAMQVSQSGDLANWIVPNQLVKGFGGAADLAAANTFGTKVIILTQHCSKDGQSKIVKQCTFPLTGASCVSMVITERCVFEFKDSKMILTEIADGYGVEDIRNCTDGEFVVSDSLKSME